MTTSRSGNSKGVTAMKAHQVKPVQEKEELLPCIQCGKPVAAWYGRWKNSGTCSKACEEHYEMRQRSIFTQGGGNDDDDYD